MIEDAQKIFERYSPYFDALNARIYTQNQAEDLLMLRWWIKLNETGDLERLILPESRRLSPFLNTYKQPTTMIYSLAPDGEFDNTFWATPVDDTSKHRAAYCGAWSRTDLRGRRRQLHFAAFVYSFAFEFYDTLLGMTWQQDLLDLHQKFGYNIVGCIPNLYDEDFLYIVHLTKANFQASRFMQVANRRR